jgi:hypothetical protein
MKYNILCFQQDLAILAAVAKLAYKNWVQVFFFAKTQKALRFDALIEKREFLHIYKLRRANTAPYNSTQ